MAKALTAPPIAASLAETAGPSARSLSTHTPKAGAQGDPSGGGTPPDPAESQEAPSHHDLIFLVALFAAGLTAFQLGMVAKGHGLMRVQHLAAAVEYARGHIDLVRPVIPGFNANGTPTPLDFPIWQGLTAALMNVFGPWYGWGNVVSLGFMFGSLAVLFDLARRLFSPRVAWWTLLFSLSQPLYFLVGGAAAGDGPAWAFALGFLYAAYRMMADGGWRWWPAAVLTGCLSATTKAPFFMTAGLAALLWLLHGYRRSWPAWVRLGTAGALSCAALFAWQIHCQRLYAEAEFPLCDLRLLAPGGIQHFYFGGPARVPLRLWATGLWRLLTYTVGNFTWFFLLAAALGLRRTLPAWSWLAAAGSVTLLFSSLIIGQVQYSFIFSPGVALLCARAAEALEPPVWRTLRAGPATRVLLLLAAFVPWLAECSQVVHLTQFWDPYKDQVAQVLRQHTVPADKLVVWGDGWGEPFMRAQRQGLTGGFSLQQTAWLNDTDKLARLKQLGYNKLVLENPSPFLVALTTVTGSHYERNVDLLQCLPEAAKAWPVVFQSPSVLIVEIPK